MSHFRPNPLLRCLVWTLVGVPVWLGSIAPALGSPTGSEVHGPGPATTAPTLVKEATLEYPAEARALRVHGDVSVLVDVNTEGVVTGAHIESGPQLFHEAALDASWSLMFEPAVRDGQPIGVTTRVRFHFAPPDTEDGAFEIIVHADSAEHEDTRPRVTIEAVELERAAGSDLAQTISKVPGVTLASGTADAAKPIIRGHQERRLLVLYDGVRHENQKWGPDHATEIDPFAAGEITVIRGAAGTRYGPDAMGGVVLVTPPALREAPGFGGKTLFGYATNGQRPYGAVRLDAVPTGVPRLALRVEGNLQRGASLSTPTYVLGNTASQTANLGASVGYRWDQGTLRATWHRHEFMAGAFYGVRASTPDEFEAQLTSNRPISADLWSVSYDIDRPYQQVSHDIATLHTTLFGDWGSLHNIVAFQHNHRQEFEQARASVSGPQYDFTLRTTSVDSEYRHPDAPVPFGTFTGGAGVQGSLQENVYRGLTLLPNFRAFSGGAFGWERLALRRVDLEIGARYDAMSRTAYLQELDYERHERRGVLDDDICEPGEPTTRCPASYETASVSVGAIWHTVPEHVDLKFDLSTASRFPNLDELFLLGSTPSLPVYALGDPSLGVETSRGGSLTAGLRVKGIEAEVSGYQTWIDDYIYFAPNLGRDGTPRLEVTIQGAFPSYAYSPIQASFYGSDGSVQIAPEGTVGLALGGALVRAIDLDTGDPLIGIPADRVHAELIGRPPPLGPLHAVQVAASAEWIGTQFRAEDYADLAPPPQGATLLGARMETEIHLGRRDVRIGVEGRNLLNTRYREATSLLRYYADQPGRDLRVRVGMDL